MSSMESFPISAARLWIARSLAFTRRAPAPREKRAKDLIADLCDLRVITVDNACILRAADLTPRYQVSYWDGLILAAAEAADARILLLTEDFSHGQVYGRIRAVHPFLTN